MASSPKWFSAQGLKGLKARWRYAFALGPEGEPLSPEDMALLERTAEAVVARGMAVPAVVFLESVGPMNFLGSQALHFFAPILDVIFPQRDVQRVALLLERRDTLSRLVSLIESRTEVTRTARRP